MLQRIKIFFLTTSLFALSTVIAFDQVDWAHLELGAGNYGEEGHTKTAIRKTVLQKIEKISPDKNFLDDLEEVATSEYLPENQYRILFWTLDELVQRYGNRGFFHINDLCPEYAEFATKKLQEYAKQQGYDSVIIESRPGDYQLIKDQIPYTSVHLKNFEISFYHDEIKGDKFLSSKDSRKQARELLQELANLSENGLFVFAPYRDGFIPPEEREEFIERNIFYHRTDLWEACPYVFPDGSILECDENCVLQIPHR